MPREKTLANLNSVPERDSTPQQLADEKEELDMFTNTTFYDFDIGRNTDVATTVDELLMQQEKQLQFPQQKSQQTEEAGTSGHGYSDSLGPGHTYSANLNRQPASHDYRQFDQAAASGLHQFDPNVGLQFDIASLQEFSLAGELPITSQHFYPGQTPSLPNGHGPQRVQDIQTGIQLDSALLNDLHQVKPRNQRLHEQMAPGHLTQGSVSLGTQPGRSVFDEQAIAEHSIQIENNSRHAGPQESEERNVGEVQVQDRHESASSEDRERDPSTRQSAEEDKRRRNTAASARFRIKKKLREQELERTNRQLQSKVDELGQKIKQLEMENKWLRNLVVERNDQRDTVDLEAMRTRILGKADQL